MKYVAKRSLTYSRGGPGYEDVNGNWHGEVVKAGEEVSVDHLNISQIEVLLAQGNIIELPDIVKPARPAKSEVKASVKAVEPTEPDQPLDVKESL